MQRFVRRLTSAVTYAGKELPDLRGEIELRNVHFAYPTRDVPVCSDACVFLLHRVAPGL